MNLLDRIRITYGLKWDRPAALVIAEYVALILAVVVIVLSLYNAIKNERIMETKLKSAMVEKDKAEKIVIACLSHEVVKVNGNVRICEL